MIKVRNKLSNKEYYFRFFSIGDNEHFYYTPTIDSVGFDIGHIIDFDIIGDMTWMQLLQREKYENS